MKNIHYGPYIFTVCKFLGKNGTTLYISQVFTPQGEVVFYDDKDLDDFLRFFISENLINPYEKELA